MRQLPALMRRVLEQKDAIRVAARDFRFASNFLYLGRGFNFPVALEGALKLKEISCEDAFNSEENSHMRTRADNGISAACLPKVRLPPSADTFTLRATQQPR